MNFDTFAPLLDQVARVMEGTSVPWLVFAGVVLAAAVAIVKQWKTVKASSAEVVQLPVAQKTDAPAPGTDAAKTADTVVSSTLK